jgi:hypothetical protein
VHAKKKVFGTEDMARGRCGRTWQGRPHLQGQPFLGVRLCLARVARWFHFPPKCVPVHNNCNTTRGTLLVSKMCMKLVYSSRTRGFDCRNFVLRTVNNEQAAAFVTPPRGHIFVGGIPCVVSDTTITVEKIPDMAPKSPAATDRFTNPIGRNQGSAKSFLLCHQPGSHISRLKI